MGAVTGMLPNGVPDTSCMHSREIWTRVTYGLAASIFHEDMIMAFRTAGGIHELLCSKAGHGYSEPGGLDFDRQYRCMENAVGIDAGKSSKTRRQEMRQEMQQASLVKQHAGFSRVALLLRLEEGEKARSFFIMHVKG